VEVRFYRFADPEAPGSVEAYRARQTLVYEPSGAVSAQRAGHGI